MSIVRIEESEGLSLKIQPEICKHFLYAAEMPL